MELHVEVNDLMNTESKSCKYDHSLTLAQFIWETESETDSFITVLLQVLVLLCPGKFFIPR